MPQDASDRKISSSTSPKRGREVVVKVIVANVLVPTLARGEVVLGEDGRDALRNAGLLRDTEHLHPRTGICCRGSSYPRRKSDCASRCKCKCGRRAVRDIREIIESDNASRTQVAVRSSPVNLHRRLFTCHVGLAPHTQGMCLDDVTWHPAGLCGHMWASVSLDLSPVARRVEACMSIRESMQAAMRRARGGD